MECNKDEALKAKEIAEKKLLEKDFTGAKKFALKAGNLYPELDGLPQFLEVIEMYVAYEERVKGEVDCYRILGGDPYSDYKGLEKQYRKRALAIHPDKNKSVGAEGAFKILLEAWGVLSNTEKRLAYDLRMNLSAPNQRVSVGSPHTPANKNSYRDVSGSSSSSIPRYTASVSNQEHLPTRPRTPMAVSSQQFNATPPQQKNPTAGTGQFHSGVHISSHQRTPATSSSSEYNPGFSHPRNPTAGTSSQNFTYYHKSPATYTDSQYNPDLCQPREAPGTSSQHLSTQQRTPAPPCPRNPAFLNHYPHTFLSYPLLSPIYQNIPATTTTPQYFPASRPSTHHQYAPARNPLPASCPPPTRPQTFWTLCSRCRMMYQYRSIYLNQNVLCPQCKQHFTATEIPIPNVKGQTSFPWPFSHQQQGFSDASSGSSSVPESVKRGTQTATQIQPSGQRNHKEEVKVARTDEVLHENSTVPENVEAAIASDVGAGVLSREKIMKRRRTDGHKGDSSKGSQVTAGSKSGLKRTSANLKGALGAEQAGSSRNDKPSSVKELSQIENREMLMAKAKLEILRKVNEWKTAESKSAHVKKLDKRNSLNSLEEDLIKHQRADHSLFINPRSSQSQKSTFDDTDDVCANPVQTASMSVPDADFHNFDESRTEESFSGNQVWAAYDDDDGMPRYYALVHDVISRKPFKIQISWLNSKTTSEFGSLDWIGSGFTKTSGYFRVGKYIVNENLNSFSHPIKWRKGARGAIQVLPAKGDVWALYMNWSSDWNELTTEETIHKYRLVVVLEDYSEDRGVVVTPLVKVAGFTSVFHQQLEHLTIPRAEMFRFSHQVSAYILNGQEGENAPKGCYELDPAALPLELLNVITESDEAMSENVAEDPVKPREPGKEGDRFSAAKPILTYSRKNKKMKMAGDV